MTVLRPLALAGVLAAFAGCPSGYRFARSEGDAGGIRPTHWQELECVKRGIAEEVEGDAQCAAWLWPKIHCAEEAHQHLCRRAPGGAAVSGAGCRELRPIFSFVHFSDAQLKEHQIHMAGAIDEAAYDGLTKTSMRDRLLEQHDDAVLLATMLGVNALLGPAPPGSSRAFGDCPPPTPPRLAIHTGDAMDAGVFSELIQFLGAVEQLDVPFFNAVGNHDNLFFGTFPPEHMKGLNVVIPYVPVVDTDRFMRSHSRHSVRSDLTLPDVVRLDHLPSTRGCTLSPATGACVSQLGTRSEFHGFDLACAPDWRTTDGLCTEARGYYAFDVELPGDERRRTLRFVVLNTAEVVPATTGEGFDRRSRANMLPEQLRWLEQELDRPAEGEVFALVLGHHNLGSFLDEEQGDRVRAILTARPRVLAYVTAHTHVDQIVRHPRARGDLWEIIAGSTLVHPQLARLMEVLEGPRGALFLRVMSFRQQLGDGVAKVRQRSRARSGDAGVKECAEMREESSSCFRLARRAQLGRFGARVDVSDVDYRDEATGVANANALLPVYPGDRQ